MLNLYIKLKKLKKHLSEQTFVKDNTDKSYIVHGLLLQSFTSSCLIHIFSPVPSTSIIAKTSSFLLMKPSVLTKIYQNDFLVKVKRNIFHMGTVLWEVLWDCLCIFIIKGGEKVETKTQQLRSNLVTPILPFFSSVCSAGVCVCVLRNTCRMFLPEPLRVTHSIFALH